MLTEGYPPRPVSQNYEKNTLPWKPLELGGVSQKDDESSPWDLYSMYVVLQGIESLTCTRVYTKFPLGSGNLDVWSSWTGTFKKHQVTRNDKFPFVLLKEISFSSSPKVTPTTGVVEQWKKTALQWKPMELGGVPQKDGESSPWDLYSMYVVLPGIGSLPCIRV